VFRRAFIKCMIAAGTSALLGGAAYAYRSNQFEVSYERAYVTGIMKRLRVVAISDVHAPSVYGCLSDLVCIVNKAYPDIFILAGDIIDTYEYEGLVRVYQGIAARYEKTAVLGNWEYLGKLDLKKLKSGYESGGVLLLVNDILKIQGLFIVGLDDFLLGAPDYEILNDLLATERPVLVISHCPESFDYLPNLGQSPLIILSGHTHGGQIAPFGFLLVTPEGSGPYVEGWYRRGKHSMYVMRGIGTAPGIPLRIGARPEVLVLDLIPNSS
jgi:predicted MPP superfamily phosphohydrolase